MKPIAQSTQLNKLNQIWNAHFPGALQKLLYADGYFNSNITIIGTGALALHGLLLRREIEDLDIAILNPTKKQLELLEIYKDSSLINNYPQPPKDQKYNLKLKANSGKDLFLNIMTYKKPVDISLYFKKKRMYIGVGGIEDVMLAKLSYREQGRPREKDVLDVQYILNNNFNYMSKKVLDANDPWDNLFMVANSTQSTKASDEF